MNSRSLAAAAATALAATLLAGCDGDDPAPAARSSTPPASTASPGSAQSTPPGSVQSTPPGSAQTPTPPSATALGPHGYGALRLGMNERAARGTGLVTITSAPKSGGCGTFDLKGRTDPKGDGVGGYLSARYGVASIFARSGMATPEGITVGSTRAEVKRAYPRMEDGPNASFTRIPGTPKAMYGFLFDGGRVRELTLDLEMQDCHN
ncbi:MULTISPECIES: hypothetical protein [Actinomadura]|uniref:Lipoprotein n=1 Tax=Actinomadura yumaensis TaxID=111807 RepID=A0ABW2CG93_9ACTN|nr:hypothetical protein [Actinomadura sp. J1-007]MWK34651.1 hypothetical protein [Actinomadura sp. J1-007]